jgi:hypothetical protein
MPADCGGLNVGRVCRLGTIARNPAGRFLAFTGVSEGPMAKSRRTARKAPRGRSGSLNALFDASPRLASTKTPPLPTLPDIFTTSDIPTPSIRPLSVYAFDPSMGHFVGNYMTTSVLYEPLKAGPVGQRFAVIDYDGANNTFYKPVDLDDPKVLIKDGFDPSESDPRFHQQMVYAVASETLQRFEHALGRHIPWRWTHRDDQLPPLPRGSVRCLNIYPHAMCQANAFYSPDAHAILFGYFRASRTQPGRNLPGQTIFTCLSHDIVAHETTHAIVDGIRRYFTEPTNIDVPAFHEAFADLAALFLHFAHKHALLDTLQKTGGKLFQFQLKSEADIEGGTNSAVIQTLLDTLQKASGKLFQSQSKPEADVEGGTNNAVIQAQIAAANPLIQLAQQFGEASGMRAGLRSALGTPPNSNDIKIKTEPHDRGSILVAAVFDAYFTIYTRRTADLFRIYRSGGGRDNPIDLPAPLADRLATEASSIAEQFFVICARALDYCPPVDITFGDFLRAILTADVDLRPSDPDGVRDALMQAFRLRGIVAEDARFFSEESLCWPRVQDKGLPRVEGLVFGDPNGLTRDEQNTNGGVLGAYAKAHAELLGFAPEAGPIQAASFHPVFHLDEDGRLYVNMVVELVQTVMLRFDDPTSGEFPMRNGVTLIISQEPVVLGNREHPKVLFAIRKPHTKERQERIKTYYLSTGRSLRKDDPLRFQIDFGLLHAGA